jgi:hypothetical protein
LRMNEFGKEWDEVWFRSGWFISEWLFQMESKSNEHNWEYNYDFFGGVVTTFSV